LTDQPSIKGALLMSISQNVELIIKLSALQTHIFKHIEAQLSIHGISFTEFLVMYHLNKSQNKMMRRIELAESIGFSASGVTRLLIPMEKIGLVKKEANPRDARVSLVTLTESGEGIYKDSEKSFDLGADSLMQKLNEKQINKFIELTEALL
jgi:DNA-binding MarR family transcriptional regulator